MSFQQKFMDRAVELSSQNIDNGGGPFGAVIVKNGAIIAEGANGVTRNNDPTAHAEVTAIRAACQVLNSFNLEGCEIYTSCEPCPMCLSAIYWAHLDKIYYANTKEDAAHIDFDDQFIYEELKKTYENRSIPIIKIDNSNAIKAFQKWEFNLEKIKY